MPLSDEELNSYVTDLLISRASQQKSAYEAHGFKAFLQNQRKSSPVAKPNKRFLRNLVRHVDGHNEEIRKREERDAKERLRDLRRTDVNENTQLDRGDQPPKFRLARDRSSEVRIGHKRRREGSYDGHYDRRTQKTTRFREKEVNKDGETKKAQERIRSSRHDVDRERRRRERKHDDSEMREKSRRKRKRESTGKTIDKTYLKQRTKEHDKVESNHFGNRRHQHHHSRSQSLSDIESRLDEYSQSVISPSSGHVTQCRPQSSRSYSNNSSPSPLIGPDHVISKGRGTYNKSHTLDFSNTSPPPFAHSDSESDNAVGLDDWGKALKAMKARQAYFSQKQVGSSHGTMINEGAEGEQRKEVKWAKMGEGREWDRGKIIDGDTVKLRVEGW